MARMRMIKPGFFTNDTLAELDPLARLLFIGLWCIADREGRLDDRPKRIKVEVMPYDDVSVDSLLQTLHDSGFILRYAHGEHRYIQVLAFSKHQSPHMKEQSSIIPAPYLHGASTVLASEQHTTSPSDTDTDTDTDTEYFVAADADDAPLSDTTPSSQAHTSSEQKTATGKRRATSKASPAKAATFAPDNEAYRLAAYLRDAILSHKPDANVPHDAKTLQGWAVITDKMARLDKRDPAKIRAVIDWATRDTFWAANVLSPGGLRDKFDRLELEMGRKANASNGNGNGHSAHGKKTGKSGAYGDAFTMDADEYGRMMREGMENMGFTTNGTTGGTRDK